MNERFLRRVQRNDRIAQWLIHLVGIGVIAMVIMIMVIIAWVALPLFLPAGDRAMTTIESPLADGARGLGVDEYLETGYLIDGEGRFHFFNTGASQSEEGGWTVDADKAGQAIDVLTPPGQAGKTLRRIQRTGQDEYVLTWKDGTSGFYEIRFVPSFDTNQVRTVGHTLVAIQVVTNDADRVLFNKSFNERDQMVVTRIDLHRDRPSRIVQSTRGMRFGRRFNKESTGEMPDMGALDHVVMSEVSVVGARGDTIRRWSIADLDAVELTDETEHEGGIVTALAFVNGDISLAVGDESGGVHTYMPVVVSLSPEEEAEYRESGDHVPRVLTRIHDLRRHNQPVSDLVTAQRDKMIVSIGAGGKVQLDYMTNERALGRYEGDSPVRALALSPRNNGMLALHQDGSLALRGLDIPHPESSFKALFAKIHYENYPAPKLEWQAAAGHQSHEPKFSLMPLIFGTLKATFWALLFAAPIAVLGALYSSQFMSPRLRNIVKPAVEIMAAVPSVVVGFMAAFWFGPILAKHMPSFFAALWVVPLLVVAAVLVMRFGRGRSALLLGLATAAILLRSALLLEHPYARLGGVAITLAFAVMLVWMDRKGTSRGTEFLTLIPIIVCGVLIADLVGSGAESAFLTTEFNPLGSFHAWMTENFDMSIQKSNAFLIMFALGFAVMPIVFTLSDDALSAVPRGLSAASLALGASRWQTAWKVVLPSASPGIFAAIMIGFGRAIGETMIVLMAAGGTPTMHVNPFEGMLTLSANIATEIPEVPVGSTHYRVLFFSAVLLFAMTFLVNTMADMVRVRLRRKFGNY